jgi:hypothetical protein
MFSSLEDNWRKGKSAEKLAEKVTIVRTPSKSKQATRSSPISRVVV